MSKSFSETLKKLRTERGLSQQQLANKLFVDRSSIANWENNRRVPDAILMTRLAECLNVSVADLLQGSSVDSENINVILVDDEEILLAGTLPVLSEALPDASITGFTRVSEAITFAKNNPVSIAFLDIELGTHSGIDLCKTLLEINPKTNVIFLTSYPDYAIKAWETEASGFLVKPLQKEDIVHQLGKLRHSVGITGGGTNKSHEKLD